MAFKSALFNNATLQKLTVCGGLLKFERNRSTNEMELTTPTTSNMPLKLVISLSIVADKCNKTSHLKQSNCANMVWKGATVRIVIRKVINKAFFFRII